MKHSPHICHILCIKLRYIKGGEIATQLEHGFHIRHIPSIEL